MKRAGLVLIAGLALAACQGEAPDQPTSGPSAAPSPAAEDDRAQPQAPAPEAPVPETLAGEWRVAGVGGEEVDLPFGITASIDEYRIELSAGCTRTSWRYTYRGGVLATERQPLVTCQRGLYPIEERLIAAIDSADRAARTPSNAVELSGGAGSVTLYSQ